MSVELTVIISIACTVLGASIGFATFLRNGKREAANDAKNDGVISSELGYIKAGIDEIKRKQDKQDEKFISIYERLTKVEASAERAHGRLDLMEGKR